MKWFRFTRGNRRSVAKRTRANDQRLKTYRPRFDALEERLPPGDTVLGGLLAGWWAGSASGPFIPQADSLFAPEGPWSGASPWSEAAPAAVQSRRGDRTARVSAPIQGSDGQRHADSQGWRPGLTTVATPGLGDELTDGIVSNPARPQRAAMPLSPADLHAIYRPADPGNGFTGLIPTQPFWVTPALPAAQGTPQEIHLPALPLEAGAETESPPAR